MLANVMDDEKARYVSMSQSLSFRDGPFSAEIVQGQDPVWHVLRTGPSEENLAAAHLSGRRFGVYVPTFEQVTIVRASKRVTRRPLFPGHVFLFVWDILQHWRRIKSCPGVVQILTVEERPVVVSDEDIHRMQFLEFGVDYQPKRHRKRSKLRGNAGPEIVTISTKSYWDGVERLADDERIGVLHRALGLA